MAMWQELAMPDTGQRPMEGSIRGLNPGPLVSVAMKGPMCHQREDGDTIKELVTGNLSLSQDTSTDLGANILKSMSP